MVNSEDRGRGILSPADREYLSLSPEEYDEKRSHPARIQRRDAIPERVWNAFLDGRLLFNQLDDEQRRRVFDGWGEFADKVEAPIDSDSLSAKHYDAAESRGQWLEKISGERGFAGLLAFVYLGLSESDEYDFEALLNRAVERAERSRGREVSTFSLDIEAQPKPSTDELLARFESRQELAASEINRLREAGEIDDTDLIDYYDEVEEQNSAKV
jgi:hypothetical protein